MLRTTIILLAILAGAKTNLPRFVIRAQSHGPHQNKINMFLREFKPALERLRTSLPASSNSYAIQIYALDRKDGVYVTLVRRSEGGNNEVRTEIPIDKATPKEAARDTLRNIKIGVECDLAGKGLTNCRRGTDGYKK